MRYTATKYQPLARKHGLDAWEVASAAFEVMLAPSTRNAGHPWAVVTRAVQITCHAETSRLWDADISQQSAPHARGSSGSADAVRFAERERLADYHPRSHTTTATRTRASMRREWPLCCLPRSHYSSRRAGMLHLVAECVEHVAYRLADLSSRQRGVEVLRRDRGIPTLLEIPPRSWSALLRIVLGHPDPKPHGYSDR